MDKIISYTKSDLVYEFIGANGEKLIMPIDAVILVDEGDSISIKNTASRKTIGVYTKSS